jgi:membrane protease YdiL (CAAX protease family)
MPLLPAVLLIVALGGLWWMTRNDVAEYAAFKRLTATRDRQRRYRAWVLKSFALFFGVTVVSLLVLGRLAALASLPPEFTALSRMAQAAAAMQKLGSGFLIGLIGGVAGAGVAIGVIAARRRPGAAKVVALGDIGALMPRNWAETAHTALMSVNAGVSEEMFFRLLLPLLLALMFGDAAWGFVGAAIVFGLAHVYQGWAGVVATTVVGVVFTGLYLWTGSLWIAVGAHLLLDLVGLVVRPTIAQLAAGR